jgi:hypothetical protein
MTRIPPEQLLEGAARTLLEEVLPQIGVRRARGQLYAVVDVLRNLARRVEPASAPLAAEADSAQGALARAAEALRGAGEPEVAQRLEARLAAAPAAPPEARAAALREAVGQAFRWSAPLGDDVATALRPILGAHVAAQAIRELALLQPSLLEEISRG